MTPYEGVGKPARLEGRIENVEVSFQCETTQSTDARGMQQTESQTVMTARSPQPIPVDARVYPTHGLAALGQLLGMQDIAVGDPVFDRAFIVKGDNEPAARALLKERARRAIVAFPKPTGFHYKHGTLTCSWQGWETDPRVLDAAVEAAVGLCGAGGAV